VVISVQHTVLQDLGEKRFVLDERAEAMG
jgi:hypothetical protein